MSSFPTGEKTEAKERLKILVVDDDPLVRQTIRLVLEKDYQVTEAESISESLALLDREKPDLITLDIYLPDASGMEGLHQLRQRSDKIPIILVSGYATFKLAQEALRLGATDYVTKPFMPDEIYQTVKAALAKTSSNGDVDSGESDSELKLRLPLQNLQEEKFLSPRHRSHFLAFAQNVLSNTNKKRTFETISLHELIQTITMQFEALRLKEKVTCEVASSNQKLKIHCDMYLLGGALANLVFTCMLETKADDSPFVLSFESAGEMVRVFYKKSHSRLPEEMLAHFERWHLHPNIGLDADTTMLILAENAIKLHHGQFILNTSSFPGSLLEIRLPLSH